MKQTTEFHPISRDCGCAALYSKHCRDNSAIKSQQCRQLRQTIHLKHQQNIIEPYEWDLFSD
ncbi:hypothetical protein [Motiliproteus sp. MSK22-1]|uniref:hypothetical protein n=1 Tax=Motiliproteus sp. MSK22-1 TaxID=1897630 RepID=UPI000977F230|nr:hypothetical protein [Motiliproteus sp. MSK22-1]OMH29164.1 hypothetical protein BGP75_20695 [Motiliproteus sp. MSK22-1]